MTQQKKPSLDQVLKLVALLTPEEQSVLREKLDERRLTWANVDLENPVESEAFFLQEEERAEKRINKEVAKLQKLGILDADGRLLKRELPPDMQPGSQCDVGG